MRYEIVRKELLNLLDKGLNYPLTLVVAAPGFGKSTLLQQWTIDTGTNTVIWLELNGRHNDRLSIFKKIFSRLKNSTALSDALFFNLFKPETSPSAEDLVDVLIQAFELVENRLVIIIDDFHVLQDPFIQNVFSDLIERLPGHVNFVLSSRRYPDFPLSRFKLAERILIIDGNDLKLSKNEMTHLNAGINRVPLAEKQMETLLSQTEGWFVGVKLALLAYDRTGEPALNAFNGSQPELLNYFGYEVLKNLSADLRKFVLGSALFERFDAALCDHVFNSKVSVSVLEKLVAQELFIVPVQGLSGWFRYHALLQEFLQNRLLLEAGKDAIEKIHHKAASHLIERELWVEGIRHAHLSKDSEFYYSVLSLACNQWIKSGEFESVLGALAELPDDLLLEKPTLLTALVYALIFSRRFNQAHYYLELTRGLDVSQQTTMKFLKCVLQLFQRDGDGIKDVNLNLFSGKQSDIDIRAFSAVLRAYIYLNQGLLQEAFKAAHEAKALLSKIGHFYIESYADLIIILCDRYMGRGIEAIQYMTKLYRNVNEDVKMPVWVNLATGMMVVHYEQNQLDSAQALCEKLLPMVNFSCATEVVSTVYLNFSRLIHLKGDSVKSSKLLDQLDRILILGKYERFQSQVAQEAMRQAIAAQSMNVVDGVAKQYGLPNWVESDSWKEVSHYQESKERYSLAAVYWLVSKGRLERASDLLTQLILMLDQQNLKTRGLIARCNLMVINFHLGNQDIATNQLKKMLENYGLVCFSRSVFDETPALETVFKYAISHKRVELPEIFFDLFKDLLIDSSETSERLVIPKLVLTEKEMAIFELLGTGLSNAGISKQTDIALSTTKWHLKNIYSKLGVTNRSGAMMVAHLATT